jgi:hypothetical protein
MKAINTAKCREEVSLRKFRRTNTMEPKVFKGEPTHVFGESYIDPDKLLKRMAEKYGTGNFCIKVGINIHGRKK